MYCGERVRNVRERMRSLAGANRGFVCVRDYVLWVSVEKERERESVRACIFFGKGASGR